MLLSDPSQWLESTLKYSVRCSSRRSTEQCPAKTVPQTTGSAAAKRSSSGSVRKLRASEPRNRSRMPCKSASSQNSSRHYRATTCAASAEEIASAAAPGT